MVPRRAGRAEGAALAGQQQACRTRGGVGAGLGGGPGAGHQRCPVVHRVQAEPGDEVGRLAVIAQRADRPDRGEGLHVRIGGIDRGPLVPGRLEEGQVVRLVNPGQEVAAVDVRRADLVPARGQRLEHEGGARRRFEARHALAAEELVPGCMQRMPGREERDHGGRQLRDDTINQGLELRPAPGAGGPAQPLRPGHAAWPRQPRASSAPGRSWCRR